MKINCLKVGELQCNCYLLEKNNQCLLIDPGDEYNKIKEFIKGKNIISILITHNHFDHVGCVEKLKEELNIPVYKFINLEEGKHTIDSFDFEVIHNPGHSIDSISFYFKEEKVMFTGDFLFKGTIGRCDLEGGSIKEMFNSISKIKNYSNDIKIYPGHGELTTLGEEKQKNPYFL